MTKKIEKYFVLKRSPICQNDRYWSPVMAKAMRWLGMVDGLLIGPIWVEGSMDQYVYQEMMRNMFCLRSRTRGVCGGCKTVQLATQVT